MINLYDIAWGLGVGVAAPYWYLKSSARQKVLKAFRQRMGRGIEVRSGDDPCILIHAVSLGEMNATRALVQKLRDMRPGLKFVISSTTETGYTRGQELYVAAADVELIYYPLDFSAAINRVLDATRPDVVVLMELEVWPNFVKRCRQRGIPVVLANGRLTTESYKRYRWGGPLVKSMFRRLTLVCAQDDTYGVRFRDLGVPHHHIVITGTMKFDNANLAPPPNTVFLKASRLGIQVGYEPLWVCGSTGPGEEDLILRVYRRLLKRHTRLRLVLVPRHPQRFDEVADIVRDHKFECVRISQIDDVPLPQQPAIPPVVLIDAMGVLRDFYSLADVVFVGRSLVDLGPRQHGSDMIEPAALAKPVIVGPYTSNFADAMIKFRAAQAVYEVASEESLEQAVGVLLSTPSEAKLLGRKAVEVVRREQGATARHARVIMQILCTKRGEEPPPPPPPPPDVVLPHDTLGGSGFTAEPVTQSPQWLVIRPIR